MDLRGTILHLVNISDESVSVSKQISGYLFIHRINIYKDIKIKNVYRKPQKKVFFNGIALREGGG